MAGDFQNFGVQYQFTENIGNSFGSKFRTKEEVVAEYESRGFQKVELRNAVDSEGNILAYTFNVYCYKKEEQEKGGEKTAGFVSLNDLIKGE